MPKVPSLQKYVTKFGNHIFSSDGDILFSKICETKVNSSKLLFVTQLLKTSKHERSINRQQNWNLKKQLLFTANNSKKSEFSKDLCKAMLCANISLHKDTNIEFRSFLEKYTLHDILRNVF